MTGTNTPHGSANVSISGSPTQVIRIEGEVDLGNAMEIDQRVTESHAADVDHVVIDLTETSYLDSAGLAMLVRISTRLTASRTPMTVVAPDGSTANRVISLSGLTDQLSVQSDIRPPA